MDTLRILFPDAVMHSFELQRTGTGTSDSLSDKIADAFYWAESVEGDRYWIDIYHLVQMYERGLLDSDTVRSSIQNRHDHYIHYLQATDRMMNEVYETVDTFRETMLQVLEKTLERMYESWEKGEQYGVGYHISKVSLEGRDSDSLKDFWIHAWIRQNVPTTIVDGSAREVEFFPLGEGDTYADRYYSPMVEWLKEQIDDMKNHLKEGA